MQSDLDRNRLLEIGLREDKVKTVGNIKFDRNWTPMDEKEYSQCLDTLNLSPQDILWVAGSTHRGEEDIILDVLLRLRTLFPALRLIIAPREVARAEEIERLVLHKGLKPVFRTGLSHKDKPCDVLILDTLGELERIYGMARISFVGGSLMPIGGHNLLEPASFGKPVLFGTHTDNFILMSQLLVEAGGGRRARQFVEMNRGALGRVMEYIENYLA